MDDAALVQSSLSHLSPLLPALAEIGTGVAENAIAHALYNTIARALRRRSETKALEEFTANPTNSSHVSRLLLQAVRADPAFAAELSAAVAAMSGAQQQTINQVGNVAGGDIVGRDQFHTTNKSTTQKRGNGPAIVSAVVLIVVLLLVGANAVFGIVGGAGESPATSRTGDMPNVSSTSMASQGSSAIPIAGLDYHFNGAAKLVTTDKYTFDFAFALDVNGPIYTSVANDKPGQATLIAGTATVSATLTNTTPGRNASIMGMHTFHFIALYSQQHAVCRTNNLAVHTLAKPAGEYCSATVATVVCINRELQVPPSGILTCSLDPAFRPSGEFAFPKRLEPELPALEADLKAKRPILALVMGSYALDHSRYDCVVGLESIIMSTPVTVDC